MKLIITSGYFTILTNAHISYLSSAKYWYVDGNAYCQHVCIVNNDIQQILKKGKIIHDENSRLETIWAIKYVDAAILSIDKDRTINKTLEFVYNQYKQGGFKEFYLMNGGDVTQENIREKEVCERLGIKMVFGVGGRNKINSSSRIIENIKNEN